MQHTIFTLPSCIQEQLLYVIFQHLPEVTTTSLFSTRLSPFCHVHAAQGNRLRTPPHPTQHLLCCEWMCSTLQQIEQWTLLMAHFNDFLHPSNHHHSPAFGFIFLAVQRRDTLSYNYTFLDIIQLCSCILLITEDICLPSRAFGIGFTSNYA